MEQEGRSTKHNTGRDTNETGRNMKSSAYPLHIRPDGSCLNPGVSHLRFSSSASMNPYWGRFDMVGEGGERVYGGVQECCAGVHSGTGALRSEPMSATKLLPNSMHSLSYSSSFLPRYFPRPLPPAIALSLCASRRFPAVENAGGNWGPGRPCAIFALVWER